MRKIASENDYPYSAPPLQIEARAPDITCTNLADRKGEETLMDRSLKENRR
jgi:hypothetical protein